MPSPICVRESRAKGTSLRKADMNLSLSRMTVDEHPAIITVQADSIKVLKISL